MNIHTMNDKKFVFKSKPCSTLTKVYQITGVNEYEYIIKSSLKLKYKLFPSDLTIIYLKLYCRIENLE